MTFAHGATHRQLSLDSHHVIPNLIANLPPSCLKCVALLSPGCLKVLKVVSQLSPKLSSSCPKWCSCVVFSFSSFQIFCFRIGAKWSLSSMCTDDYDNQDPVSNSIGVKWFHKYVSKDDNAELTIMHRWGYWSQFQCSIYVIGVHFAIMIIKAQVVLVSKY